MAHGPLLQLSHQPTRYIKAGEDELDSKLSSWFLFETKLYQDQGVCKHAPGIDSYEDMVGYGLVMHSIYYI